eukprot:TRINITY_DN22928_c0_g1_i1.p1 TRINITY_DN22928_c0_g1~~TRINITY_DN22928_c0_g1_i1.p1  ORF type:complete len:178 (+),score=33.22 TRINITY_DN22928_c0_g1_i1:37-570(+)
MWSPPRLGSNDNVPIPGCSSLSGQWQCAACGFANNQQSLFQCRVCMRVDEQTKKQYRAKVIQPARQPSAQKTWGSQMKLLEKRKKQMEEALMKEANFDSAQYKPAPRPAETPTKTPLSSIASISQPPSVVDGADSKKTASIPPSVSDRFEAESVAADDSPSAVDPSLCSTLQSEVGD